MQSRFPPYQKECDNYSTLSINHEWYLQLVQKSTLLFLDDKRCYKSDIEIKPWE